MTDTISGGVGVLGGGAWGTALAAGLVDAGRDVHLWAREEEVANALNDGRGNPLFLPDTKLPRVPASTDMAALSGVGVVLAVVPAQYARPAFNALKPHLTPGTPIVLCSKGIEQSSLSFLNGILHDTLPDMTPAVLSGPSFAKDVARGLPTAVTLATEDAAMGKQLMAVIGRPNFRPYWTDDIIGAEVGGAVKNVLAIACGIVEGLELGRSAHAALISRGFAEMTRLGVALGGRAETLAGLSGLGDLVLTCSSPQSRNMSFGMALGQGEAPADILAKRQAVTEGVATAPALIQLAKKHNVDMPICQAVASILANEATVTETITALLSRPFKEE